MRARAIFSHQTLNPLGMLLEAWVRSVVVIFLTLQFRGVLKR